MLLYQVLAFTIHEKNIKKSYKNNKCKISAPTWNEEFELPDGSYSVDRILCRTFNAWKIEITWKK